MSGYARQVFHRFQKKDREGEWRQEEKENQRIPSCLTLPNNEIEFMSRITQMKQFFLHSYHVSRSNKKVGNRFPLCQYIQEMLFSPPLTTFSSSVSLLMSFLLFNPPIEMTCWWSVANWIWKSLWPRSWTSWAQMNMGRFPFRILQGAACSSFEKLGRRK